METKKNSRLVGEDLVCPQPLKRGLHVVLNGPAESRALPKPALPKPALPKAGPTQNFGLPKTPALPKARLESI